MAEQNPYIIHHKWTVVCRVDDLEEGKPKEFEDEHYLLRSDSESIFLLKLNEKIYAMDARCIHQGGDLSIGDIEDIGSSLNDAEYDDEEFFPAIVCPVHEWRFSLRSGQSSVSKGLCQETFPVRINDEHMVEVKLKLKEYVEF